MYKGTHVRPEADFSAEILQDRKEWHDIFQGLKEKQKTSHQEYAIQQSCHS